MANISRHHRLRAAAISDLSLVVHPTWGLLASGTGRFTAYFGRDAAKSIMLSLSKPANSEIPQLLEAALASQRTAKQLQGKKLDRFTEEAPGKMPHEFHDHNSPQDRLDHMRSKGWPVYHHEDGSLGMLYYGASDTTSLFIISVATVARLLLKKSPGEVHSYLQEFWPYIEAGLNHDIHIADIDGDGLIESNPQNMDALLNHTWKDSNDAYRSEEGHLPKPPYKYLNNNCYFLWALREAAWMAGQLGFTLISDQLKARYEAGVKHLHQVFWVEEHKFFAPLIDANGQPVMFIGDDVLDGLWGEIFYREYAEHVIARLHLPDMNTSRGLRTRSSASRQFRVNGTRAYHNGLIWLHRNRIAAEGFENYGHTNFAEEIDEKIAAVETRHGRVECIAVGRTGRFQHYKEQGVPVACKPQTWAVFGTLARTALTQPLL